LSHPLLCLCRIVNEINWNPVLIVVRVFHCALCCDLLAGVQQHRHNDTEHTVSLSSWLKDGWKMAESGCKAFFYCMCSGFDSTISSLIRIWEQCKMQVRQTQKIPISYKTPFDSLVWPPCLWPYCTLYSANGQLNTATWVCCVKLSPQSFHYW